MAKLPWFKFRPDSWLSDEALRLCSYGARGLWIDMLSLMHKSDRRGFLLVNSRPPTEAQLARMTGGTPEEVRVHLQELIDAGAASVSDDGVLFSKRMVRDAGKSRKCSEAGKRGGGNPTFKGDSKGHPKGSPKGTSYLSTLPSDSSLPEEEGECRGGEGGVHIFGRFDWPQDRVAQIYRAYPKHRQGGHVRAHEAIRDALTRVQGEHGLEVRDAMDYLLERVKAFAASPRGQGQYAQKLANWMDDGGYDEPYESWQDGAGEDLPEHEKRLRRQQERLMQKGTT